MHDLLLPPDITGLSNDQNCLSQLNLILIFSQVPLFVVLTVLKLNKRNGKHLKQLLLLTVRQIHEPCHS